MPLVYKILRPALKVFEAALPILTLFSILVGALIIFGLLAYISPNLVYVVICLLFLSYFGSYCLAFMKERYKLRNYHGENKWEQYWRDRCINCEKPLLRGNECICHECGTIQNADCVTHGDRVIYFPTSYRYREWIGEDFEKYHYYPGMEMAIKEKVASEHRKGFFMLTVQELNEKPDLQFCAGEFRKKEFVDENMLVKNIEDYLFTYWHDSKFEYFEFRKGQRVRLHLSFLTKAWHRYNASFTELKDGETYTITKIMKRRYFWLNDIPCNIYWKDVETLPEEH